MPTIRELLDAINAKRAAMSPEERAALEERELAAQRESWVRAMAPCEHGDPDWETCPQCRAGRKGER
jgi:hypothetical protein